MALLTPTTIARLAEAVTESGSYEEFILRCRADEEVSAFLDYVTRSSSPAELYSELKPEKRAGPGK